MNSHVSSFKHISLDHTAIDSLDGIACLAIVIIISGHPVEKIDRCAIKRDRLER